ncbi:hypothetical protein LOK49_LG07G00878 [Camellia lanceoleosa]|uniref:Uncharacterized protein n=1 Tax=Camellia lanceoleosa TaxID=1840588 RepID=A0ACC0H7C8_9ERIC|nr:hypothetical protein LOK49_LG07G00878 [Camellia lanceoleosa]
MKCALIVPRPPPPTLPPLPPLPLPSFLLNLAAVIVSFFFLFFSAIAATQPLLYYMKPRQFDSTAIKTKNKRVWSEELGIDRK